MALFAKERVVGLGKAARGRDQALLGDRAVHEDVRSATRRPGVLSTASFLTPARSSTWHGCGWAGGMWASSGRLHGRSRSPGRSGRRAPAGNRRGEPLDQPADRRRAVPGRWGPELPTARMGPDGHSAAERAPHVHHPPLLLEGRPAAALRIDRPRHGLGGSVDQRSGTRAGLTAGRIAGCR